MSAPIKSFQTSEILDLVRELSISVAIDQAREAVTRIPATDETISLRAKALRALDDLREVL